MLLQLQTNLKTLHVNIQSKENITFDKAVVNLKTLHVNIQFSFSLTPIMFR